MLPSGAGARGRPYRPRCHGCLSLLPFQAKERGLVALIKALLGCQFRRLGVQVLLVLPARREVARAAGFGSRGVRTCRNYFSLELMGMEEGGEGCERYVKLGIFRRLFRREGVKYEMKRQ